MFKIEGGKTLVKGVETNVNVIDGYYEVRSMSVSECARLQTMPFDYCKDVSNTQAYKCLGNGWTTDIIIHILRQGLKDTPRHERIEVLSMYDGIGTAMYCLRQLGFENIVYTAYEIDINAIKVAKSNWPGIHEKGDAFQIREGGIYGL